MESEKNIFSVPGKVHPSEYDWKSDFAQVAEHLRASPAAYIEFDTGKVMGLCSYIEELQSRLSSLESALKHISYGASHAIAQKDEDVVPRFFRTVMEDIAETAKDALEGKDDQNKRG